jgi:hypothetical protein
MECRIRVPGAGQSGLTARIRLLPTTQPEYVKPPASTSHALPGGCRVTRDGHRVCSNRVNSRALARILAGLAAGGFLLRLVSATAGTA